MSAPSALIRESGPHCPRCGSAHLHASHRRGAFEGILASAGAKVRRCHSCRLRQAWFESRWLGSRAISLAENSGSKDRWLDTMLLSGGFLACLAFIWWMITRFTQ